MATEKGYGKRTRVDEYPIRRRGAQGVLALALTPRIGPVVSLMVVRDQDEVMIMSSGGTITRLPVKQVSILGRATQGVKLIQIEGDDRVVDLARLVTEESGEANGTAAVPGNGRPAGDEPTVVSEVEAGLDGDVQEEAGPDEPETEKE